ncbi:hypothetical protein [Lysinibacillus sp. G4S2]|uniref:hypothetical protein n=1 Tax=Lysinibacillus sp. G4S2 TaxID=3055859 RepID=UPI0025A1B75B|nr:hypothetical protein [Lysinibacillus sp. G4S2]MDM5247304.1 hypothetical protein [Lysinibacillus sp. G4S2]
MDLMTKAGYEKPFRQSIKEREEKGWGIDELEKKPFNFEYGESIFIKKITLSQI